MRNYSFFFLSQKRKKQRKNALKQQEFRRLRPATNGSAFGNRNFLEKN
jgi:hypothetical protein